MTETPYDDLIQDLHAMCERGFRCQLLSATKEMCVTCKAAHHLYLCYIALERITGAVPGEPWAD